MRKSYESLYMFFVLIIKMRIHAKETITYITATDRGIVRLSASITEGQAIRSWVIVLRGRS